MCISLYYLYLNLKKNNRKYFNKYINLNDINNLLFSYSLLLY